MRSSGCVLIVLKSELFFSSSPMSQTARLYRSLISGFFIFFFLFRYTNVFSDWKRFSVLAQFRRCDTLFPIYLSLPAAHKIFIYAVCGYLKVLDIAVSISSRTNGTSSAVPAGCANGRKENEEKFAYRNIVIYQKIVHLYNARTVPFRKQKNGPP